MEPRLSGSSRSHMRTHVNRRPVSAQTRSPHAPVRMHPTRPSSAFITQVSILEPSSCVSGTLDHEQNAPFRIAETKRPGGPTWSIAQSRPLQHSEADVNRVVTRLAPRPDNGSLVRQILSKRADVAKSRLSQSEKPSLLEQILSTQTQTGRRPAHAWSSSSGSMVQSTHHPLRRTAVAGGILVQAHGPSYRRPPSPSQDVSRATPSKNPTPGWRHAPEKTDATFLTEGQAEGRSKSADVRGETHTQSKAATTTKSIKTHFQSATKRQMLKRAIRQVVVQQQRQRPGAGENLIALLRQMRGLDIHLGGLVEQIVGAPRLFKQGSTQSALTFAGTIRMAHAAASGTPDGVHRRWPELLRAFRIATEEGQRAQQHQPTQPSASELEKRKRQMLIHRRSQVMAEENPYDALQFEAMELGVGPNEFEAAKRFDARHLQFTSSTQRAIAALTLEPDSIPPSIAFQRGVKEVFRNRCAIAEEYDPFIAPPRRREFIPKRFKRTKWRLEDSIWAARRETSNSKDFYETPSAVSKLTRTDWDLARVHHQLATFILRTQLDAGQYSKSSKNDHLNAPEVVAVYNALERHAACIYGAFAYYACLGKGYKGGNAIDSCEVFYVRLNQFFEFVADCRLTTPDCDLGQISNIWSVVDAHDRVTKPKDLHNISGALNRHEWLQLIVRLAVRTRLTMAANSTDMRGNVADAVDEFCEYLEEVLPPACLLNHNVFRSQYCYNELTDRVLRRYEPTLRTIFASYAALGNHGMNDMNKLASTAHMSIGEWLEFLSNIGLIQLGFVNLIMAMQAFSFARIRSCSEYSNAAELRMRQLQFEDFLEALVRVAYILAAPTAGEIEETNAIDGGDFLMALYTDAPAQFRQFVARRTGDWISNPRQPISKCLACLLSLIKRLIEANAHQLGNEPEGPMSPRDKAGSGSNLARSQINGFMRRRREGALLNIPLASFDGSKIVSVMQEIEAHNTKVLSAVPAFSGLNASQINILRDAMSAAKFAQDEYVFEQGAYGDAFYLITCGYAEVLRVDPNDPTQEEVTIAQLSESDCFGELALLRNEPRAASIVAASTLDVLFITRADFEKHLGPLSNFQLAEYDGVVHSEGRQAEQPGLEQDAGHVKRYD